MKPLRMCMVCRERREKADLIRIVKSGDKAVIDLKGKMQGRGAYLCKNKECISQAQRRKTLERAFSGKTDVSVYEELLRLTEDINEF